MTGYRMPGTFEYPIALWIYAATGVDQIWWTLETELDREVASRLSVLVSPSMHPTAGRFREEGGAITSDATDFAGGKYLTRYPRRTLGATSMESAFEPRQESEHVLLLCWSLQTPQAQQL